MSMGKKKIALSTAILLFENFARLAIVAFVSFWIARELGPAQYGILNFASAFVAIFLALSTLGLDNTVITQISKGDESSEIITAALVLRVVASVIATILGLILIFVLKSEDEVLVGVTLIVGTTIFLSVANVFDYWFLAHASVKYPSFARITGVAVSAVIKIILLILGYGVYAISWVIALETLITSMLLLLFFIKKTSRSSSFEFKLNINSIRGLLNISKPYIFSSFAIVAYMKIDVVMMGYFSSLTETGVYSLTQKLSEFLYVVPVVIIESIYPSIVKKSAKYSGDAAHQGQLLFDLAVGGSIIALLVSLLMAKPAINFTFGSNYDDSINLFYLHAWSCIAIAMNTARHRLLALVGLQKFAPYLTMSGLIVNVVLNLFLIPMFGAFGACISTLVSYFLSGYVFSYFFNELRSIAIMQTRALWPWGRLLNG